MLYLKKGIVNYDEHRIFNKGDEVIIVQDFLESVIGTTAQGGVGCRLENGPAYEAIMFDKLDDVQDVDMSEMETGTIDPKWWSDTDKVRDAVKIGTFADIVNLPDDKKEMIFEKTVKSISEKRGEEFVPETMEDIFVGSVVVEDEDTGNLHKRYMTLPAKFFIPDGE
jgi:hypothetical protein